MFTRVPKLKKDFILLTVRFGSTRLPGKCMLPFSSSIQTKESVLEHVVNRAKVSNREIIVCTSLNDADDSIVELCKKNEINFFRGSEENKIKRWYDCFVKNGIDMAHLLDVDDPFFCNDEINSSMDLHKKKGKLILATSKSKSGNASVGITIGLKHLALLNKEISPTKSVEMVDDLLEKYLKYDTLEMQSLDPIPSGTRLTLDYFEDYLALSVIKSKLGTHATREEVNSLIFDYPWITKLNGMKNVEWKTRQNRILESQEDT